MDLSEQQIILFRQKIYNFYQQHRRSFVWREFITPYAVVVSEIMLQQTQTARVIYKFDQWLAIFPTFEKLAQASTVEVLQCWQGLGYNRRGLALHQCAKRIVTEFAGKVPQDPELLKTFKGVGPNTAGSICAFAFNMPVVFIETNIRTVFIHEFFKDQQMVADKDILLLIAATLDQANPRQWYYALMDYGVYLKKELKVSNKASRHYTKQSKFIGSRRQLRGAVVKILTRARIISYDELQELMVLELPDNRHDMAKVVESLCKEGFLRYQNNVVQLCG